MPILEANELDDLVEYQVDDLLAHDFQNKPKFMKKPSPFQVKPIPSFQNCTALLAYLQEGSDLLVKIDTVEHNQGLFESFPFRWFMESGKAYIPKLFKFFEDFVGMMESMNNSD